MLSSLTDMAVFAAVARDGSFTAAARSLAITKQSVSERISRLEASLGVQLVIRSTRALRLTDAGQHYAEACASILEQAEAANRAAQQAQLSVMGTIRVTAPVGLGRILIFPVVREYRLLHPAVGIEVLIEDRIADLVRESIDVAVRAGSVASTPSFVARQLFSTDCAFVVSPTYVLRHGKPAHAGELTSHACIAKERRSTWKVDGRAIPIDAQVVVDSFAAAHDAVLAGNGIAQIPIPIVIDDVRAGRLQVLFGPGRHFAISALRPVKRSPLRVRLFLELLSRRAAALGDARFHDLPRGAATDP
jgi:DNA-binding transcriptional LysR family regulator